MKKNDVAVPSGGLEVAASASSPDAIPIPKDIEAHVVENLSTPQRWSRWSIVQAYREADPGTRIATRRILKKFTQLQLAELAGVRQSDISNAEEKFDEVRVNIVKKIAAALGTSFPDLVSETGGNFSVDQ